MHIYHFNQTVDTPAGPSLWHEHRRSVLDNIAVLAGYAESPGQQLPDGVRPDVIRINASRRMMFMGDAKHSETPGCTATEERLLSYFRWARAFVLSGGTLVFAVCYGRLSDSAGWLRLLCRLCEEVELTPSHTVWDQLDHEVSLAWVVVR